MFITKNRADFQTLLLIKDTLRLHLNKEVQHRLLITEVLIKDTLRLHLNMEVQHTWLIIEANQLLFRELYASASSEIFHYFICRKKSHQPAFDTSFIEFLFNHCFDHLTQNQLSTEPAIPRERFFPQNKSRRDNKLVMPDTFN